MDLKSGLPYWLIKSGLLATYPPLEQNTSCDVAVVGGGLTGALAAYFLAREGVDVLLVEKRDIGQGSTCANTALLLYELDTHLGELIERCGEATAVRSYQLGLEAIQAIESLVQEVGDRCGFERKASLYLASRKRDAALLEEECRLRARHGFKLDYLDRKAIEKRFPFSRPAALSSQDAAVLDPYRFTHKLLEKGAAEGLRVYDATEVTAWEATRLGIRLVTQRGPHISARKAVFAAGYEMQPHLPKKLVHLKSTYAVVTEPVSARFESIPDCLIWEASRPYLYLRPTTDRRVLIGGEDEDFASPARRDRVIGSKARALVRRFEKLFPSSSVEMAYCWAGTFGETDDGLPYIGAMESFPGAYFALSYGPNGTTFAAVSAQIICDLYLGRRNTDSSIFRFDR